MGTTSTAGSANSLAGTGVLGGQVYGGQQPVSGSTVRIWRVGTTGYGVGSTLLASTTTNSGGAFQFATGSYTCDYPNSPLYITATGGDSGSGANANIEMIATLGVCSNAPNQTVNINEVTTAATVYALAGFMSPQMGQGVDPTIGGTATGFTGTYNVGLNNAILYTAPMLVNMATGMVNDDTATRKVEASKIYTLANVLASCVNSQGETSMVETTTACGRLMYYANATNASTRPYTTLQAALQIALYPYSNVSVLYGLAPSMPPFGNGLTAAPTDWTLGVSYTTTGMGIGVDGTSATNTAVSMDIDANGKVWFPTNIAGAGGVGFFDPSTGTFNGPFTSPALTHPQHVAVNTFNNYVYATDTRSGSLVAFNMTNGAPTYTTAIANTTAGGPLYVQTGGKPVFSYTRTDGTNRLGTVDLTSNSAVDLQAGLAFAPTNLIYSAEGTNISYGAYSTGGTDCAIGRFNGTSATQAIDAGSACTPGGMANSGVTAYTSPADALMTVPALNQICAYGSTMQPGSCFAPAVPLNQPRGIATDGSGSIWVANAGNGSVSTFNGARSSANGTQFDASATVAYLHNATHGGTMTNPWALAIDASGNVWTVTPDCLSTDGTVCTPTKLTLSVIIGAATPTVTPLMGQNDRLSGTRPAR